MKYLIPLIACVLLTACNSKTNTKLYMLADNSYGLQKADDVVLNGYKLGSVTNVSLTPKAKILVTIELNEDFKLPDDSEFLIEKGLLGGSFIDINFGASKQNIASNDTILAISKTDTTSNKSGKSSFLLGNFIESVTKSPDRIDSLLQEIHSLKIEVDSLQQQLKDNTNVHR